VDVDTYKAIACDLPFKARVDLTAKAARDAFERHRREADFLGEGRTAFEDVLNPHEEEGALLSEYGCFLAAVLMTIARWE
jgi:hypothetical protein